MPQVITVLRCYGCQMFQAQIQKKSKKWTCSLCGEKQSLIRTYGSGTGKECRLLVQELNSKKLQENEDIEQMVGCGDTEENIETSFPSGDCTEEFKEETLTQQANQQVSKWAKYLDEPVGDGDSDEER